MTSRRPVLLPTDHSGDPYRAGRRDLDGRQAVEAAVVRASYKAVAAGRSWALLAGAELARRAIGVAVVAREYAVGTRARLVDARLACQGGRALKCGEGCTTRDRIAV